MADIDVVPKDRSYTWLWVLLALVVIVALIWAFTGRPDQVTELLPQHHSGVGVIPLAR
jgi:hypothetical protein